MPRIDKFTSIMDERSPVRLLRLRMELSQRDFAFLLGVSQKHISHIELCCDGISDKLTARFSELGIDGVALREHQESLVMKRAEIIEQHAIAKLREAVTRDEQEK